MYSLECMPDELYLQIFCHLSKRDLQTCRLISPTLRFQIDRLFPDLFCCLYLSDHNIKDFKTSHSGTFKRRLTMSRKASISISSNFTRMKVNQVSQFTVTVPVYQSSPTMIRSLYFDNLMELEFTHAIGRTYFHRIIELARRLKILRLNSAVLGGTENLFGLRSDKEATTTTVPKITSLLQALPFIKEQFLKSIISPKVLASAYRKITELYLTLDYVTPVTPNFSPFVLVENLNAIRNLPVYFLRTYSVKVEESGKGEQFYFTITSLLNTIPVRAYECLKTISFEVSKCRQENGSCFERNKKRKEKMVKSMTQFSELKLNELRFKIKDGYKHEIPGELEGLMASQKYLEVLDVNLFHDGD